MSPYLKVHSRKNCPILMGIYSTQINAVTQVTDVRTRKMAALRLLLQAARRPQVRHEPFDIAPN